MSRPRSVTNIWPGIVSIAALAMAGCAAGPVGSGAAAGLPPADPGVLHGRTYTAQTIIEKGRPRAFVAGTSIELRFPGDGRLVANAGCNTISGAVATGGGKLGLTDMAITEMGCQPEQHDQDQRLSAFLGSRPSWRLDGETLILSSADTTLVLTRAKAAPLVGTAWRTDTLILGDVAGATPAGVDATLVFGRDQVTVSGLCNLRAVRYRTTPATIAFELDPLSHNTCAPEIMRVEQVAVGLFDGRADYRIDHRTLTISKGDKGLLLVAQD